MKQYYLMMNTQNFWQVRGYTSVAREIQKLANKIFDSAVGQAKSAGCVGEFSFDQLPKSNSYQENIQSLPSAQSVVYHLYKHPWQAKVMHADHIAKYCCSPRVADTSTGDHGSGFIVQFKGLQKAKLLASEWQKHEKTNYALVLACSKKLDDFVSNHSGW